MMLSFPFSLFRALAAMQAEIIALCHQVIVLQRTQKTWDFQQPQMAVVASDAFSCGQSRSTQLKLTNTSFGRFTDR